ncbi:MAG: dihydrolipoamide acetyltransferase, partial [Verrucomicrobiaceae bacterium]
MSVNIEMPKLSDTMTEGTLVKWHKNVGDTVEIGDILADVETDKATMEMEAFDDGVLTEIKVQEGEKAAIGAIIAVLDGDSGAAAPAAAAPAAAQAPQQAAAAAPAPAAQQAAAPAPAVGSGERVKASPLARKIAAESGVDLSTLS